MEINTLGMKPRGNCCPHAIIQNFINFDFTVSNMEAAKKMFLPAPLEPRADEDGDVILTCGFLDSAGSLRRCPAPGIQPQRHR